MEFKIQILFLLLSSLLHLYPCQTCLQETTTTLDCSNLSLTDIPHVKLGIVNKLDLSQNAITILKNDSFLDRGLQNVGVLFMQDNQITTVEVNAFRGMGEVTFINLSNNDIVDLPEDIFQWNTKLRVIRFENNTRLQLPQKGFNLPELAILDLELCGLKTIPTDFFTNMPDLEILYLRGNKLSYLDPKLITHLNELELLDLRDNLFTQLQLDILRLPLVFKVSFVGNPLQCDCSLLRYYSLYKKKAPFEHLGCMNDTRNHHETEVNQLARWLDCNSPTTTVLPTMISYESTTDVPSKQNSSDTPDLDINSELQQNKYLHNGQEDFAYITATQIGVIVLCVIILLTLVAVSTFFIAKNRSKQFVVTNRFRILQDNDNI